MEIQVIITLVYLLFLLLTPENTTASSTGLTIKLIQHNSSYLPYYTRKLTGNDSIETSLLRRSKNQVQLKGIRPKLSTLNPQFPSIVIEVGLGTFSGNVPFRKYRLLMDTACEIIWLQCEDCLKDGNHCYESIDPPFPNSQSSSYRPLPCNQHPLCYPGECKNDICTFWESYDDGLKTEGILGSESFTFPSSLGTHVTIPNLVFGCGTDNTNPDPAQDPEVGVLGLGWGPRTFPAQLPNGSGQKFSYCLQSWANVAQGHQSYLTFGEDIQEQGYFESTPLIRYRHRPHYYLNLLGIFLGSQRLPIPQSVFQIKGDGSGGVLIDTGAAYSYLITDAYDVLENAISAYINGLRSYGPRFSNSPFKLCFKRINNRSVALPPLTFQFSNGADLVVQPNHVFVRLTNRPERICLGILSNDDDTTIGAYQQSNTRFIYDRAGRMLKFRSEDCR